MALRVARARLLSVGAALLTALQVATVTCLVAGITGVAASDAHADEGSKRAWLGVALEKSKTLGVVVAKHVVNKSPAAKAGIADGDQILAADGVAIAEPSQLIAKVAQVGPGSALPLRIRHAGSERDISASLVPFPGTDEVLRLDKVGTFAPGWKNATAVAGSLPANIASLRGKVVLVDFWASWCGPCRMMAPQLSQWQASYGAQGLTVIGLTDDPAPAASTTAQAWGMTYAVGADDSGSTSGAHGVTALPTMFLIDKKGVIREAYTGFDPGRHREMEKTILAMLAEP